MSDLFAQLSRYIAQCLEPDACLIALGVLALIAGALLHFSRIGE